MAPQAFDKNAGRAPDAVREGNQPSENVLADVLKTPQSEQRAIIAEAGGRGKDVPPNFKSPDGTDATIVKSTEKTTQVNTNVEYKPEEVVKGEKPVSSTLGNDTQWSVTLPEVGRKETPQTTKITKEVAPEKMSGWSGGSSDFTEKGLNTKQGDTSDKDNREPEAKQATEKDKGNSEAEARQDDVKVGKERHGIGEAIPGRVGGASHEEDDSQKAASRHKRH